MKKYSFLISMLLMFLSLSAKEQTIKKVFNSSQIDKIEIESKYGEITVETSDRKEISIEVVIKAESNKEETIEKIFSNVDVDFVKVADTLKVKTNFGQFFTFLKAANSLFRGGEFSIDFKIKAPDNIALDVNLKGGNIVLFERKAPISLNHSDGYVSSQNLYLKSKFVLRDSYVKVEKADSLDLNMRGGSLDMERVNVLYADTYNSRIIVEEIGEMQVKSVKDVYIINKVKDVDVKSSISHLNFGEILSNAILVSDYGSLQINSFSRNFNDIKVTERGAKLRININENPVNIAISHTQSAKLDIPEYFNLQMRFGQTNKDFITTGTIGNPSAKNQLLINCKGGELILR